MRMRIGIDLGGTKTEIIALDSKGGERLRRRVPTPSHSYDAILATIARLVRDAESHIDGSASVGIGTPGALSAATGAMKNANSTILIGRSFTRDVAQVLARPVRVANDANCFALSEAIDGAGAGSRVVFGVILGTGAGGGIVIERHILIGRNAIAGEWGHNPLPWAHGNELPGPPCYCGKFGCIETFVSGTGLEMDHAARGGPPSDARAIVRAAQAGEAEARASLERYVDRLARALASVINVLDPDTIVLGGGMSNVKELYDELPQRLRAYVFSDRVDTAIVAAAHGDSSGVRGAAWLWEPDAGRPRTR